MATIIFDIADNADGSCHMMHDNHYKLIIMMLGVGMVTWRNDNYTKMVLMMNEVEKVIMAKFIASFKLVCL